DVLTDVPAVLDRTAILRAISFLRLVVDQHLGEVEGDVFGQAILATAAAGADRGHQNFLEGDDQVLDLVFTASLADGQLGFRIMLAVGAGHHQVRRRLVDKLGQRQVLDIDLAGTAATTDVHGAGLGHAPAPGQYVDLVNVCLVVGFALDVADLDEHINSHDSSFVASSHAVFEAPAM